MIKANLLEKEGRKATSLRCDKHDDRRAASLTYFWLSFFYDERCVINVGIITQQGKINDKLRVFYVNRKNALYVRNY